MGIIKCFLDIANDLRQGKKDLMAGILCCSTSIR